MNFTEILTEYNISISPEGHHHAREGWVQFDCPLCGKGTHGYHMGYNISFGYVNCWRCGHHSLLKVVMEITGLSLDKCRKLLSQIPARRVRIQEKPRGKLVIPSGVNFLNHAHLKYLIKRNYKPLDLEKLWDIQGIGLSSRLAWRIFIPIYYHGEMVSWTTRSIADCSKVTRYISASPEEESINHKHLLYGEDFVRDTIIICEGPFDVWRIGCGAVATLGTGYSKKQVIKMTIFKNRYVCFDNEKEAQQRAKKLCNTLSLYPGDTSNIQLSSKDVGTATKDEIIKLKKLLVKT